MSPESIAVLHALKNHGAHTLEQLLARFPDEARGTMNKRLHNLKTWHWIDRHTEDGKVFWVLRSDSRPHVPVLGSASARPKKRQAVDSPDAGQAEEASADEAEVEEEPPLPIVPPRQVDAMTGPLYKPDPAFIARPGALDASRIPSRGTRC